MAKKKGNAQPTKWKPDIVDGIVLVILVLAVALLAIRAVNPDLSENSAGASPSASADQPVEPYVITYYCDASLTRYIDQLEKGQRITDDTIKQNLGALLDYECSESVYWEPNDAGVMERISRDDANALKLITVCDACVNTTDGNTAAGIRVKDGPALSVGHTIVLKVGDTKFYMAVYGFQKLSESPYAGMELPEYGHVEEAPAEG